MTDRIQPDALRSRQCLHGISEPSGWMPIETAPKNDRTLLLGRFNSHGKWRTMRGQWMSENYIAEHWEDPDGVEPGWFETAVEPDDPPNCWPINPTHWMPLPPSPSSADEGGSNANQA